MKTIAQTFKEFYPEFDINDGNIGTMSFYIFECGYKKGKVDEKLIQVDKIIAELNDTTEFDKGILSIIKELKLIKEQ